MAELTHLFRAQIFLRAQIKIVAASTVILCLGIAAFWGPDPDQTNRLLEEQMQEWLGIGAIIGVILASLLGYRAHRSALLQPIGAAFSVAWRIGVVWVVIFALAEFGVVGNAVRTVTTFPLILFSFILVIASGFMLGYLANPLWSNLKRMSPPKVAGRDWMTAFGSAIVIIAALVGLVLDIQNLNFFKRREQVTIESLEKQVKKQQQQIEKLMRQYGVKPEE